MIKIRYATLPEGLHAQARRESGHTIIYLRPGLSSDQRREALRRARQTARMGHGPRLPVISLAWALAADRAVCTLRNAAAAVRCHPFGAGMLAALLAGAVVSYSLFVTVSVRFIGPQVAPNLPHPAVALPAPDPGGSSGGTPRTRIPGSRGGSSAAGGTAPGPAGSGPGSHPSPSRRPTPAPSPSSLPPSPAPSPSPTGGGVCVQVGPLGICLSL
jgi:hypothetical protein